MRIKTELQNKRMIVGKMKIKILFLIVGMLFLIGIMGSVSAGKESLGVFKVGQNVRIVQVCDDATWVNISSISYPNGSIAASGIKMVPIGSGEFYYNFSNTAQLGRYDVRGISDGCEKTFTFYFEVTYTGDLVTSEQMTVYIIALIFLVLLALALVFIINKLPNKDAMDEEGTIVQVSQLKHLRPVLWAFIWIIGVGCLFIISNIGFAYLQNQMIGKFFFTLYRIFFYASMVMLPIWFIWIFYKVFKDKEMKRLIEQGVEFKGGVT